MDIHFSSVPDNDPAVELLYMKTITGYSTALMFYEHDPAIVAMYISHKVNSICMYVDSLTLQQNQASIRTWMLCCCLYEKICSICRKNLLGMNLRS